MKKVLIIICICLLISTILFACMWQISLNNHDNELSLAQEGAREAYADFLKYQESSDESYYWSAVASFYSFQQAYYFIIEGTNNETYYTFCNEVYAKLIFSPAQSQNHINDIIDTMKILSNDVQNANGYNRMGNLRNLIQ